MTVVSIPITELLVEISAVNINTVDGFSFLAFLISVVALFEAAATIIIRHFWLVKPASRRTLLLDNFSGAGRFLLINMLNWFIAATISTYGDVLYIMSGKTVFLYVFGLAALGLIVYHAPFFTRYESQADADRA